MYDPTHRLADSQVLLRKSVLEEQYHHLVNTIAGTVLSPMQLREAYRQREMSLILYADIIAECAFRNLITKH